MSEPFKIYRVWFGWKNIQVDYKTVIGETNHFWKLETGRKMSKGSEWDGSQYCKTIEESANNLLSIQEKTVSNYIDKLNNERNKLIQIEKFIKEEVND